MPPAGAVTCYCSDWFDTPPIGGRSRDMVRHALLLANHGSMRFAARQIASVSRGSNCAAADGMKGHFGGQSGGNLSEYGTALPRLYLYFAIETFVCAACKEHRAIFLYVPMVSKRLVSIVQLCRPRWAVSKWAVSKGAVCLAAYPPNH